MRTLLTFLSFCCRLGLTDYLTDRIQALRVKELADYSEYRKFVTHRNVISAVPPAFAPALTLMMFTLVNRQQALNPTVAFTTLALVALLTSPIQDMIHAVPMFQVGLASLDRVQSFLLLDTAEEDIVSAPWPSYTGDGWSNDIELAVMRPKDLTRAGQFAIIALESASVTGVLHDITLAITPGSLTLIVGPVGSGKSTLLQAMIGTVRLCEGRRHLDQTASEAAFCAQDPWLPNDTVRNLVLAHSAFDPAWYAYVVGACALDIDIASFPRGDETVVGSKGISLSGGQRQRLALVRAVYARKALLVADDVFSGLDASTSKHVFDNIFGIGGICKRHGMTAVVATHAVQHLRQADEVIALGQDGSVMEQGSFTELTSRPGYVHHLRLRAEMPTETQRAEEPAPVVKATEPSKIETAQQDLARRTGYIAV